MYALSRLNSSYLLCFLDLAEFEVWDRSGSVIVWHVLGASPGTVENLHLNHVLSLALGWQWRLGLHANAVKINGRGVVFTGKFRRGKLTREVNFAGNGARFVTDSGLQLDWLDRHHWTIRSHSLVHL